MIFAQATLGRLKAQRPLSADQVEVKDHAGDPVPRSFHKFSGADFILSLR